MDTGLEGTQYATSRPWLKGSDGDVEGWSMKCAPKAGPAHPWGMERQRADLEISPGPGEQFLTNRSGAWRRDVNCWSKLRPHSCALDWASQRSVPAADWCKPPYLRACGFTAAERTFNCFIFLLSLSLLPNSKWKWQSLKVCVLWLFTCLQLEQKLLMTNMFVKFQSSWGRHCL